MTAMIQKYAKALTSFAIFAFAAIALFWGGNIFGFHINADFESKVISLIPLLGATVAVVMTKNVTQDAVDKAVSQLLPGLFSIALFFHEIPAATGVKIGGFIYAFIAATYAVWRVPNKGVVLQKVDPPGSAGMLSH